MIRRKFLRTFAAIIAGTTLVPASAFKEFGVKTANSLTRTSYSEITRVVKEHYIPLSVKRIFEPSVLLQMLRKEKDIENEMSSKILKMVMYEDE